jgi:hypothetical protein
MKIIQNMVICSILILSFSRCANTCERRFISEYEFEDFSQFNDVSIFYRSQNVIFINAPNLIYDTVKVGYYVVKLDKKNSQITETKWMMKNNVNADTVQLKQLAQTFMKYEIPRLNVDKHGNVFVYLADIETLALVRFVNIDELLKYPKREWVNISNNWYKPK